VIVPCGWLSAALLMSALANSPIEGASAMAVFALTSMPGLFLPGLAWQRMSGPAAQARLTRLAGLALVVASGWSLTQEVWSRVGALCGLG
jgi:sulfite exporter TauE/SafE